MRRHDPHQFEHPPVAPRHAAWGRFIVSATPKPPCVARLFQGRGWQTAVHLQFGEVGGSPVIGRTPFMFVLHFHTEDGPWQLDGLDLPAPVRWPAGWSGHLAGSSWALAARQPDVLPSLLPLLAAPGLPGCYSQLTVYAARPYGLVDAAGRSHPVWLRLAACQTAHWTEAAGMQAWHFGRRIALGHTPRWRLQAAAGAAQPEPQAQWQDLGVIELDDLPAHAGPPALLDAASTVPGIVALSPAAALPGRQVLAGMDAPGQQRLLRNMAAGLRRVAEREVVLAVLEQAMALDAGFGTALAAELDFAPARQRRAVPA
ncbi:hypothetical protein [Chitinolyticbacter meiyuanensis]|uniref:hypothetical protein n=1 Tax=Chitinolyticbacter meiyuanensis TaxID=682798 RepID=UPI0011E5E0A3|nr:hypothetical protein [Chitinolyticbacter meiyuanensis]